MVACGAEYGGGRTSGNMFAGAHWRNNFVLHGGLAKKSHGGEQQHSPTSSPYLLTGLIAFSTPPWMPSCCIRAIPLTSLLGDELKT